MAKPFKLEDFLPFRPNILAREISEQLSAFTASGSTLTSLSGASSLTGDKFCFGNTPTLMHCGLIPQLLNARRSNVDYSHLANICAVESAYEMLETFSAARPLRQHGAE